MTASSKDGPVNLRFGEYVENQDGQANDGECELVDLESLGDGFEHFAEEARGEAECEVLKKITEKEVKLVFKEAG